MNFLLDVTQLIKTNSERGILLLLVQPVNVKLLTEASRRTFPQLDYYQMQRDSTFTSSLDDLSQPNLRATPETYQSQPFSSINKLPNALADPTQPLPREISAR